MVTIHTAQEAVPQAPEGEAKYFSLSNLRGRLLLFATVLASGMAFLSGSMVIIALPNIQDVLSASLTEIQWITNAPYVILAALILIGGSLGDRFGRKRMFLLGIGIFSAASLGASFAVSAMHLIAYQSIIGLGAAFMIPGSLALINSCFYKESRGRAIGYWAGFSGGIAAFAPLIGGWLVQTFGWQAVFFINVPLGMVALAAVIFFVPESKSEEPQAIDWLGMLFIILALLGLAFGLMHGPSIGWSSSIVIVPLLFSAAAFAVFLFTETRVNAPVVPLRLFKNPLVSGANLATLFLYFALTGFMFFFVLNLQQIQGYTPIAAGLALLPAFLLIAALSGYGGTLADKYGPRMQMIIGPTLVGIAMVLLAHSGLEASYVFDYLPGIILFGIGMALTIAPLTKSALAVSDSFSGLASGINNAISRFASLLAVAILGAIMVPLFASSFAIGLGGSSLTMEEQTVLAVQQDKLGGIVVPPEFSPEAQNAAQRIVHDSFISGFSVVMWMNAALAFLAALIALLFIRPRQVAES